MFWHVLPQLWFGRLCLVIHLSNFYSFGLLVNIWFCAISIIESHFPDAGSPWCDALPHHVCPEHGAHPLPALAPEPWRTGAGPRAQATPCRKGRRAHQLRVAYSWETDNCAHQGNKLQDHPYFMLNTTEWERLIHVPPKRTLRWSKAADQKRQLSVTC